MAPWPELIDVGAAAARGIYSTSRGDLTHARTRAHEHTRTRTRTYSCSASSIELEEISASPPRERYRELLKLACRGSALSFARAAISIQI